MRTLILILVLVLACVMVLFGVQNTQLVTVRFLAFESGSVSLSLVMVFSAVAGAALVGLFSLWDQVRHGLQRRRLGKNMTSLERRTVELEGRLATVEQENADLKRRAAEQVRPLAPADGGAGSATMPGGSDAGPAAGIRRGR